MAVIIETVTLMAMNTVLMLSFEKKQNSTILLRGA